MLMSIASPWPIFAALHTMEASKGPVVSQRQSYLRIQLSSKSEKQLTRVCEFVDFTHVFTYSSHINAFHSICADIQTCMCLCVHGCFNCLFACVQSVPTCSLVPFTTEWELCKWPVLAIFVYCQELIASQSSEWACNNQIYMFVDRLATDDMQSCNSIADVHCTCTCTYAQLSVGWGRRGLATNLNVLWQVRGWGFCLLIPSRDTSPHSGSECKLCYVWQNYQVAWCFYATCLHIIFDAQV